MNRTDAELDSDWKPNGRRPQSTIARTFSAELEDLFRIDNSVADLDANVNKKKQEVTTQTSELEALERRIREMEERLKRGGQAPGAATGSSPRAQRSPLGDTFSQQQAPATGTQKELPQRPSRPGTAKAQQQSQQQMHGGAMPPTPTASEGEYELVPEPHYASKMSSSSHTCNDSESGLETRSFADLVVVSKDGDHDS
ncbi:hypothetical protein JX266_000064 [Neoarthrinium moseri]|uniref:uncharacterized protein n=1 Tax=Neoarthrinium moseri TaxID=1658444 RepID=UPI001FDB9E8B|nr:uncharacterized protein JN550_002972 [Neoarthrinium moseri]KAI1855199.1 hypothetical protein JX266_000064 [Neoarthrinium moseri]KAI1873703.1 hypothetical protein JN550_002972 [Neoarthrinium moseri]